MYRFFQIAVVSMLGVLISGGPLSDLELPKIRGWQLPDGTMIFHEYDLIDAGIDCEMIMCAYPVGTTSRCDGGKLFAATGGFYDDYASTSGAVEISYSPITEVITLAVQGDSDGFNQVILGPPDVHQNPCSHKHYDGAISRLAQGKLRG